MMLACSVCLCGFGHWFGDARVGWILFEWFVFGGGVFGVHESICERPVISFQCLGYVRIYRSELYLFSSAGNWFWIARSFLDKHFQGQGLADVTSPPCTVFHLRNHRRTWLRTKNRYIVPITLDIFCEPCATESGCRHMLDAIEIDI